MTGPRRELRPGDPGYAARYAQHHRILCAHADQDDRPAHWLEPDEKCPDAAPIDPARIPLESDGLRELQDYLDQALPEAGQ